MRKDAIFQQLSQVTGASLVAESTCNVRDLGSNPGFRRSSGAGNGNPLQYSWLKNSMDIETWQATVHEVAKSGIHKVTSTFFFQIRIFFHSSPKLKKWQFLKGCSKMECESMNTSYSYVLKSIDLSYISNGAFYHFAIPCIDYLENNSWKLCSPANVDFDPFTVQLCYMTFINSTTDLIPPQKYWETIKLKVVNTRLPKILFSLESQNLSLATNTVSVSCRTNSLDLVLRKCLPNTQVFVLCQPFK